jgi:hypothetical protein
MSRKQSAFLQHMDDIRRAAQEASRKTWCQYLTDTAVIALNNLGWGEDRIRRFLDEWGDVYDMYFDALRDVEETDYCRDRLDGRLLPLCKQQPLEPFDKRYEFLPQMRY